jgi:hypothetical protein
MLLGYVELAEIVKSVQRTCIEGRDICSQSDGESATTARSAQCKIGLKHSLSRYTVYVHIWESDQQEAPCFFGGAGA